MPLMGLKPPEGTEMGPSGPSKAFALTGHVFNMLHDNSKSCADLNGPGSTSRHVMAPVMAHVDPEEPWSPCSAHFITEFLDNGYGKQMALLFPVGRSAPARGPLSCCILHGPPWLLTWLSSAVWDGVRDASAFVWFPLLLTRMARLRQAKAGHSWCSTVPSDLLRVKALHLRKGWL